MRELALYMTLGLAAMLGMVLGYVAHRRPPAAVSETIFLDHAPSAPASAPVTALVPVPAPPAPVDAHSTPEADNEWRREDKDQLVRRVEKLSDSDADFLCLTLGLIPRDEVFDKVNAKGRLIRHINRARNPGDIADLEAGFRQLEREMPRQQNAN
jgi:hypothetical protein